MQGEKLSGVLVNEGEESELFPYKNEYCNNPVHQVK
jgi:hypothetical protein